MIFMAYCNAPLPEFALNYFLKLRNSRKGLDIPRLVWLLHVKIRRRYGYSFLEEFREAAPGTGQEPEFCAQALAGTRDLSFPPAISERVGEQNENIR